MNHGPLTGLLVAPQEGSPSRQAASNQASLFPSIFTARALTSCSMYVLDAAEFNQVAEEYPAVKAKLQAWAAR